jgi:hypothetical protein
MDVHKGIVVAMACVGLLAGSARTVRAQAVAGSFAELQGKIKRNRTVAITDDSGRTVKGKLVDLSPTSLTLIEGHDRETFQEGKVLQVAELRRQPGKRALQGLGIGALAGTIVALVACSDCGEYAGMFALAGAGIGAAFGAPIGAAVGASQTHAQVLYRAPVQHATTVFAVTPFVSKQGTGVRVAVRF